MRIRIEDFAGGSVLFSDIVLMTVLYAVFTELNGTGMHGIETVPWLIAVLFIYGVNLLIHRKGTSLNQALTVNVLLTAGLCGAGLFLWADVYSVTTCGFTFLFFLISGVRSALVARKPIRPNQMLIYMEMGFLLIVLFLVLQNAQPMLKEYNGSVFAVLCCNLISLILIRLVTENRMKVGGSRYQGAFVIGTAAALAAALAAGGMLFLSGGVQAFLQRGVSLLIQGVELILQGILKGIQFLFSLLPKPEQSRMELEEPAMEIPAVEDVLEEMEVSIPVFVILAVLVCAAAVVLILLFVKMRHRRTGGEGVQTEQVRQVVATGRLKDSILSLLRKWKGQIVYRYRCVRYRYTPQGLYARIEQYGRKQNLHKKTGESPGAYVRRMGQRLTEQNVLADDGCYRALAEILDRLYYGEAEAAASWKKSLSAELYGEIGKSLRNSEISPRDAIHRQNH